SSRAAASPPLHCRNKSVTPLWCATASPGPNILAISPQKECARRLSIVRARCALWSEEIQYAIDFQVFVFGAEPGFGAGNVHFSRRTDAVYRNRSRSRRQPLQPGHI